MATTDHAATAAADRPRFAVKRTKDLRGPQTRIGRLVKFYPGAYLHMLTFRIMVPLVILFGLVVFAYLLVPGLGMLLKISTIVMWVLWTPQFFEIAKGLSLSWSRGMAFGHMNEEFAHLYRKRYPHPMGGYLAFPYIVLALWIVGFVVMLVRWQP